MHGCKILPGADTYPSTTVTPRATGGIEASTIHQYDWTTRHATYPTTSSHGRFRCKKKRRKIYVGHLFFQFMLASNFSNFLPGSCPLYGSQVSKRASDVVGNTVRSS